MAVGVPYRSRADGPSAFRRLAAPAIALRQLAENYPATAGKCRAGAALGGTAEPDEPASAPRAVYYCRRIGGDPGDPVYFAAVRPACAVCVCAVAVGHRHGSAPGTGPPAGADVDRAVADRVLSLPVVALYRHAELGRSAQSDLWSAVTGGGNLCLGGAGVGIFPDRLAA
ncbi:hypothetical protein D3C78_968230 [compost metagenome]